MSLSKVLQSRGAPTPHKDEILHWMWQDQWAVRRRNWKLIVNGRDTTGLKSPHAPRKQMGEAYLANLADRQPESINHAGDRPEVVKRLTRLHQDWIQEVL